MIWKKKKTIEHAENKNINSFDCHYHTRKNLGWIRACTAGFFAGYKQLNIKNYYQEIIMNIEKEIAEQLEKSKTYTTTTIQPHVIHCDPEVSFNCNLYFAIAKLLNEILAHHHQEEQDSIFKNSELRKFTYLGQIHLTRLIFTATIHPEHIKYSCFELGIFYIALLELAKSQRFDNLAKALVQLQDRVFQKNHQSAMIVNQLSSFQSWYLNEINLYGQQFRIHLNATDAGKVTFTTKIGMADKTNTASKIIDTYKNPKYDSYQKQLAFKLIEYLYLDSIFVEFVTREMITQLIEFMNSSASEDDKHIKLELTGNRYQTRLLAKLENRLPNDSDSQKENLLDLSSCDYSDVMLDLVSFTNVSFINLDKHTRLPKKFRFCIFKNMTFTEQMFQHTSFEMCMFINCNFNELTISCKINHCILEKCTFTKVEIRYADLSGCKLAKCHLNNVVWYRIIAINVTIAESTLTNCSIIFSNFKGGVFDGVTFRTTVFEGTQIDKKNVFNNSRGLQTTLAGALYLNTIDNNEYTWTDIDNDFQSRRANHNFYKDLIITTAEIGNQLSHLTSPKTLNNPNIDPNILFKKLLGWILSAVDRLKEYCEYFENNQDTHSFNNFAVFEILAIQVKSAMKHLNRFMTLYDRCHLTLMNQALLKNGIFNNFQEYQQSTRYNPAMYPQMEKRYLKETLFAIHELDRSIKYIDNIFPRILEKIEENNRLQASTVKLR